MIEDQQALLKKYLENKCTPGEAKIVESWYKELADKKHPVSESDVDAVEQDLWLGTREKAGLRPANRYRLFSKLTIAASILLGCFLFYNKEAPKKEKALNQVVKSNPKEILPGGNKAVLILPDGSKIDLSGPLNNQKASQNNISAIDAKEGRITYSVAKQPTKVTYHTISIPRGGQYNILLSDGTRIFLNSESSITFPTAFLGNERMVSLTGEAYFEVAHDKNKPFTVKSNGQSVSVLGTHFNINSYDNEPSVKTTLLEGSVRVEGNGQNVLLKPGEQSSLGSIGSSKKIIIRKVDTDEVVAWKNGIFEFHDATIKEVMKITSRWYDVDVSFPQNPPNIRISGKISRTVNFSGLVKLLEFEGVRFRIEGRKVEILN